MTENSIYYQQNQEFQKPEQVEIKQEQLQQISKDFNSKECYDLNPNLSFLNQKKLSEKEGAQPQEVKKYNEKIVIANPTQEQNFMQQQYQLYQTQKQLKQLENDFFGPNQNEKKKKKQEDTKCCVLF